MPRAEHWSQLKVGIIVFVAIVVAVAAVMKFARVGALHGDTTRLYMVTNMAAGVLSGTEVRLEGQKVGLVKSVVLAAPATDTSERVVIAMDVLSQYLSNIRRNSYAQIRPGGRLIGSPVIAISAGTSNAPPLASGDTLRGQAQMQARSGLTDASSLGDSLSGIASTVSTIKSEFDTTLGDVASLRRVSEQQAHAVDVAVTNFSHRAVASRGTIAGIMRDTSKLRSEATRVSALADSIGAAANGRGEIGRFRRDSTLVTQAHATMASIAELRSRLARYSGGSAEGAAMAAQLTRANAQLDSVVQDAKRHPLRYLPF